jgi:hypothetical protein
MSTTVTFTDEQFAALAKIVGEECTAANDRITSLLTSSKGTTGTLAFLQDARASVESIREAIWAATVTPIVKPDWRDGVVVERVTRTDPTLPVERVSLDLPHTVNGKTSDEGWGYGVTHDMDCPACVASGASFLTSPRSETYWSS